MSRPLSYNDIEPGVTIGNFLVLEKIAQGGMGAVFKGFDPSLERYVAIKVLRPEFAQDEEYLNFFQQEARAVAALRHGNIVPIYSIGVEGEILYFAMAFIEGHTFDDWIDQKHPMDAGDALWFMTQAINALDCAWRSNIVHLDIKPANFMIDATSVVMLTDFGLAQKVTPTDAVDTEREAFGTPAYVAPEQITREKTDLRTDIYSLGATLFHLMVGSPPFDGATVEEIVWGHLEKPFPTNKALDAGVPEGWISVMRKMMERRPDDRFQTYKELRAAILDIEHYRYEAAQHQHPLHEGLPTPPAQYATEEELADAEHASALTAAPRSAANPDLLHGLLLPSRADWSNTTSISSKLNVTRAQVKEGVLSPAEPLALTAISQTLLDLCRVGTVDQDEVDEACEKFPGFHHTLMAVAQFMNNGEEAEDEVDAVEILSPERVRNLALTCFMLGFEYKGNPNYRFTPLWQHSITTGIMIDFMYDALDLKRSGLEYVAGLTHDIGKMLMAEIYPFAFYGVMRQSLMKTSPITHEERYAFNIDHAELGAEWLDSRDFPSTLTQAIALHEKLDGNDLAKSRNLLAHSIVSANVLCKQLGIGYSGNAWLPCAWPDLPSTRVLWDARRNADYEYEDFTEDFLNQFEQFPDLL
ncbi:hypothetical protein DB346_10040 [Verrucomicrobia bacterium LW23]|nr:hypothetical protein DB346_10040 [Verrucomicrobia bacterium LW23]